MARTDSSADLTKLLDDPTAKVVEEIPETGSGSEDEDATSPIVGWKAKFIQLTTGTAPGQKVKSTSPTARLKLLLVCRGPLASQFPFPAADPRSS